MASVAGLASPARADRFTIGASVGSSEGEGGADLSTDRDAFIRLRLFSRLSIEAGVGGLRRDGVAVRGTDSDPTTGTRATGILRYELTAGSIRPYVLFGGGLDTWKSTWAEYGYGRREAGVGLDVKLTEGLRAGIDVRWGTLYYLGRNQTSNIDIQIYMPPPIEDRTHYVATRLVLSADL